MKKSFYQPKTMFGKNILCTITFFLFCLQCIFGVIPEELVKTGFKIKNINWSDIGLTILLGAMYLFIFIPKGIFSTIFKKDKNELEFEQ